MLPNTQQDMLLYTQLYLPQELADPAELANPLVPVDLSGLRQQGFEGFPFLA